MQVDDAQSTQLSIGNTVTAFFGTTFGFHDFIKSTIAAVRIGFQSFPISTNAKIYDSTQIQLTKSMIEEINDEHVTTWNEMIRLSDPPALTTPLTTILDKHALQKRYVALNNAKIKRIVGLELSRPMFTHESIKEMVDKWKEEKNWPVVPTPAA